MKKILLVFLILKTVFVFSQEIKFVTAPNGLILREKPNKESKRIGKLRYCSGVIVIDKTGLKLSIKDNGEEINGQWVKIEEVNGNQKGFVFGGYLDSIIPNKGEESNGYYLTEIDSITRKKYWKNLSDNAKPYLNIYLRNNNHKDLLEIPISEFELYEESTLKVKTIKGLANITKLIEVQSTFIACCASTDEFYYLVNKNNELIKLPEINNTNCDGPEPYFGYVFPMKTKGEKKKIK